MQSQCQLVGGGRVKPASAYSLEHLSSLRYSFEGDAAWDAQFDLCTTAGSAQNADSCVDPFRTFAHAEEAPVSITC